MPYSCILFVPSCRTTHCRSCGLLHSRLRVCGCRLLALLRIFAGVFVNRLRVLLCGWLPVCDARTLTPCIGLFGSYALGSDVMPCVVHPSTPHHCHPTLALPTFAPALRLVTRACTFPATTTTVGGYHIRLNRHRWQPTVPRYRNTTDRDSSSPIHRHPSPNRYV